MQPLSSDDSIFAWLREQLQLPQLPSILDKLKERRDNLVGAALQYGDTNMQKTQVAELTFVINLFERFGEYVGTDTETAEADTDTETA